MTPPNSRPMLSVIIPVKDEERSLLFLYQELTGVLTKLEKPYELIYIDDGSNDNSASVIKKLQKKDDRINLFRFHANFGKSAALAEGFSRAKGTLVVTLDADLQDDPHDIPKLLHKINEGFDLVCGWRKVRSDPPTKRLSSLLFNKGTAWLTGVHLHDMNCGLKAMTRAVARDLILHGELHRFIPVLATKRKFRVTEVEVHHRRRRFGLSKYGFERGWRGIVDLLTAIFLTDYAGKPGHFFGKIGLSLFSLGFIMDTYVVWLKLTTGTTQERLPLLLAGILLMVLGVQLISTGLIAEMILHHSNKRQLPYVID